MAATTEPGLQDRDEQRLAELGYKQELNRAWSGFQNFAISFTIISVLAGCFTTYPPFSASGVPWEDDFEWSLFNAEIGPPPPFPESP
jgi:hypothetical protein